MVMDMICKLDYFLFYEIHNNWGSPVMDLLMSWITYSGDTPLIFLYIIAVSVTVGIIYRLKYFKFNPDLAKPIYRIYLIQSFLKI